MIRISRLVNIWSKYLFASHMKLLHLQCCLKGWHLNNIQIEDVMSGQTWLFLCDRWLDKTEDDKRIERELYPEKMKKNLEKKHESKKPVTKMTHKQANRFYALILISELVPYEILIKTSDRKFAGCV